MLGVILPLQPGEMLKAKQVSAATCAPGSQSRSAWPRPWPHSEAGPYPKLTGLTSPPQFLAPLSQRGAVPIKAVAPWARCAILLEDILWACWTLAITELLQVTLVPLGAAWLTSWLHLAHREVQRGMAQELLLLVWLPSYPWPWAHPAFVAAGTMGTLGPRSQLARRGVAAAVLTVLGDRGMSSCTLGKSRLQGGRTPPTTRRNQ